MGTLGKTWLEEVIEGQRLGSERRRGTSVYRDTPFAAIAVLLTLFGVAACASSVMTPSERRPTNTARPVAKSEAVDAPRERRTEPEATTFDELERRFAQVRPQERQLGTASYYADSLAGHPMANGKAYDPARPTMAHRTLPFGTIVRVVRISTGDAVIVEVTDRGPFGSRRRIADLSREAARRLNMLRDGVAEVRLEVLERAAKSGHRAR